MVKRYEALGGKLHLRKRVVKVITENAKAVGVVISNADGRKTLLELLEGRYMDDRLRGYCAESADKVEGMSAVREFGRLGYGAGNQSQ